MRYLWLAAALLLGACPNDDGGNDSDTVDTDTVDTDTVDSATDSGAGGTTPMMR